MRQTKTARWHDQLKGGRADRLTPAMFSRQQLKVGQRHELEHTTNRQLAMEIAMDHLAEDPQYYKKLSAMEQRKNPSTSRRQQQFMCAEYGRKKRGQQTRTGMTKRQLKEYCQRRLQNAPAKDQAIWKKLKIRQLIWKAMDKYGIGLAAATYMITQKLARDPEWELLKDNIKVGVAHMRGKNPKKRQTKRHAKNPHLRSGKWQFVGMFEKRDIKQVKRILRVHGMKTKVTKDHYKREPGMRELYVERGAFATAYRAIASLFVSEKSMAA